VKALVVSDAVSESLYSTGIRAACAGVEVILSCGDLPYEYLEYLVTQLDAPLLYVLGNHDGRLHRADGRVSEGPEGGRSIDGRVERLRGAGGKSVWVAGFGGSAAYCGGENQFDEREMRCRVRKTGVRLRWNALAGHGGLDVVVSHATPRGVHDLPLDPCHRGFAAFVSLMTAHRPRLWLHGHVHPSYGVDLRPAQLGSTEVRAVYGHEILEIG